MYRRISTQSRLRRRGEEMSHGRSDSENSSKTRRCRGCTRAVPTTLAPPVSTWENSISPRRIAKRRWQSQGGKLRNCFLQAREPNPPSGSPLGSTTRTVSWNIRYGTSRRFRRSVVSGLEEERTKVRKGLVRERRRGVSRFRDAFVGVLVLPGRRHDLSDLDISLSPVNAPPIEFPVDATSW